MPNYPTSLDALANPSSTTLRNDPGFSLAGAVSALNDIAEALEAKLGIGAGAATAGTVLRATGAGASAWGAIATADLAPNAVTQRASAAGTTSYPTTTTVAYGDMPEMVVSLTTTGGDLLAWFNATVYHSVAGQYISMAFSLDGAAEVAAQTYSAGAASQQMPVAAVYRWAAPAAGAHTVKVRWGTGAATATAAAVQRFVLVMEVKR